MTEQEIELEEYRSTVREMRDYAQEQYDKLIVYLSSGGLVLTQIAANYRQSLVTQYLDFF